MFPDKLLEVLKHEGPVTIVTLGAQPTALASTWVSYLKVDAENGCLYIPAGGMTGIEKAIKTENSLVLTLGSKEVQGTQGPGAGFYLTGEGEFLTEGKVFDEVKERFPWLSRVLKFKVENVEQKI